MENSSLIKTLDACSAAVDYSFSTHSVAIVKAAEDAVKAPLLAHLFDALAKALVNCGVDQVVVRYAKYAAYVIAPQHLDDDCCPRVVRVPTDENQTIQLGMLVQQARVLSAHRFEVRRLDGEGFTAISQPMVIRERGSTMQPSWKGHLAKLLHVLPVVGSVLPQVHVQQLLATKSAMLATVWGSDLVLLQSRGQSPGLVVNAWGGFWMAHSELSL